MVQQALLDGGERVKNKKKRLAMWQMIVGLVLCGILLVTFFLPRHSLDAERIGKIFSETLQDNMEGLLGDFYGMAGGEEIEDSVAGAVNEGMEELERQGIPNHISGFYIMTHFTLRGVFSTLRAYIIFFLLVLAGLVTVILLAGFGKISKWFPISMVWTLMLMEAAYLVVILFVMPEKAGSSMPGIMGMDISHAGGKLAKQLIWSLHSWGYYIELGTVVLLTVWSICCCIPSRKNESAQLQPMPDEPPGLQDLPPVMPVSSMPNENSGLQDLPPVMPVSSMPNGTSGLQDIPPVIPSQQMGEDLFITMPEQRITGEIIGVSGTMQGAEIVLNPGENLIVGRDPSVCQLILENAKISRKHFQVGYNQAAEKYHIECYSKNGVHLSDNRTIMAFQGLDVERGTKIVLADGKEVLLLK